MRYMVKTSVKWFVVLFAGLLLSGCESDDDSSVASDEKNISSAVMLRCQDPNISEWPITSVMAPFEHSKDKMLCEWDKRTVWPTSHKNNAVGNVVFFYELDGILYGFPQEYIADDNPWRSMILWLPNGKGGRYSPTKGTKLWLMVSGISSPNEQNNIRERTQVQEVIWPIDS